MKIEKATIKDALNIHNLINKSAKEYEVLPRALSYIYENIRDYWIFKEDGNIIGCVALHIVWEDLAEIKSLVVEKESQKKGIGESLIKQALNEAREMQLKQIFVLTFIPAYFSKFGFNLVDKSFLPHKIWAECINCPKFPNCEEEAMMKEL
ncbi:MAG: N-acetyltransferase [Candidatus Saelkia tenebricola]|nr:N-acetyltransferase [Candidatus Saelkia tenebricola]